MILADQVAVVTGASSGLGREIAATLSEAGAHVVLLDRDEKAATEHAAQLANTRSADAFALEVDVSDSDQVASAIASIVERMGRIHVFVNSAGVREIYDSLDLPVAEWNNVLAINLSGTFYCCQAVGRAMADAGGGSIINISSIAGLDGAPARAAYCASKFGIVGLTKVLAHDLGPRGVRVNALCPGLIRTPLTERYFADENFATGLPKVIPLGGAGTPNHVAQAALFLASSMSEYVTGVALPVDGGYLAARSFDTAREPGSAFGARADTVGAASG